MPKIHKIKDKNDIPVNLRGTPIEDLLLYHNSGMPHKNYERAELLIGMCMDNRKTLNIPDKFAYVLRTGGANLHHNEFKVSYAISVGGVEHMALIAHTDCGMVNLKDRRDQFINGLHLHGGWEIERAREHFERHAPIFEIGNATEFTLGESKRFNEKYPKVTVAPFLYKVEDNLLYLISD